MSVLAPAGPSQVEPQHGGYEWNSSTILSLQGLLSGITEKPGHGGSHNTVASVGGVPPHFPHVASAECQVNTSGVGPDRVTVVAK